jgi:hypothetical protein
MTRAQKYLKDNNIDKSKFVFPYVEYDDDGNKIYSENMFGEYTIWDFGYIKNNPNYNEYHKVNLVKTYVYKPIFNRIILMNLIHVDKSEIVRALEERLKEIRLLKQSTDGDNYDKFYNEEQDILIQLKYKI